MTILIGRFADFTQALKTIPDLASIGVGRHDISTVAQDSKGEYAKFLRTEAAEANGEEDSHIGIGAALGGIGGLLLGLAALSIPGIGPAIAAGPLAVALAGATIGTATGGLVGALNGLGVPEFEAKAYDEGIREGGTLLIARMSDDLLSLATEILREHHALQIDQFPHQMRYEGEAALS